MSSGELFRATEMLRDPDVIRRECPIVEIRTSDFWVLGWLIFADADMVVVSEVLNESGPMRHIVRRFEIEAFTVIKEAPAAAERRQEDAAARNAGIDVSSILDPGIHPDFHPRGPLPGVRVHPAAEALEGLNEVLDRVLLPDECDHPPGSTRGSARVV